MKAIKVAHFFRAGIKVLSLIDQRKVGYGWYEIVTGEVEIRSSNLPLLLRQVQYPGE